MNKNIKIKTPTIKKKRQTKWTVEYQKQFLHEFEKKFNIKGPKEWYSISSSLLKKNHAGSLLNVNQGSLFKVLQTVYPEEEWDRNAFKKIPKYFHHNLDEQRKQLEGIAKEMGINSLEGWYKVKMKDIKNMRANSFINRIYGGSLISTLKTIYPHYEWDVKRFQTHPKKYWFNNDNLREILVTIIRTYRVQRIEDWYRISFRQVMRLRGGGLRYHGGLCPILKKVFPEQKWIDVLFRKRLKRSSQRFLFISIQSLYPHYFFLEEYSHPLLVELIGFEFDVYSPTLNIVFEYQGEQHFEDLVGGFSPVELIQNRDGNKLSVSADYGLKLVYIPYWWDFTLQSLQQFIQPYFRSENNI